MSLRESLPGVVLIAYIATGLAVFGKTLGMFFTSDDYYFLGLVARSASPLVAFEPLVGRFVRPLVVSVYYCNYHLFGLSPWTYHVSSLIPHVLSGWLIYLIAARLGCPMDAIWAFLAGLLFIVFGGHSEAVAWPAGIADPMLLAALLAALYSYLRAIEPDSSWRWLLMCFVSLIIAALTKEAWVILPGILVAHGIAFGGSDRVVRRRALAAVGASIGCVLGFLYIRHIVFGSVTGGFSGLASSFEGGILTDQARAFIIKCFLPSGSIAARLWLSSRDLLLWPTALLVVALFARGRNRQMLVFAVLATGCALLPVLPLTISVSTTESERFIYVASAFSCLLVVWAIKSVVRPRAAAVAVCLVIAALHTTALLRANSRWKSAGGLTRSIVHTFADVALAYDPRGTSTIFILNLPDNLLGAYVFRVGFYPAVQLLRPDVATRTTTTVGIASHSLVSQHDAARVVRTGPRSFEIDFGHNRIIQPEIPSSSMFRISAQTPTSYRVEFTDAVNDAIVLYVSRGRVEIGGTIRTDK